MASIFSIDILCTSCGLRAGETIDRQDKDASWNWTWECPQCQQEMRRVIGAPVVLKASYLDGQRKDLRDLKEAARLESEMQSLPPGQRAGHAKAIQQLKRIK